MTPRGRPRKPPPNLPKHIDYARVPAGIYWDRSGKGRWYVLEDDEGRPRARTVAGPNARLSELHAIVERGARRGSVEWMCDQFHASTRFAGLAKTTRDDYVYTRKVLINQPTKLGPTLGKLPATALTRPIVQRLIERIAQEGHPTKANKVLRYLRRVYRWACNHLDLADNPAQGVEAATERKQQRNPDHPAYMALLAFARERGARQARTRGSVAPYLWAIMELGYLCRLRGIETLTLVEAQGEPTGIRTHRRKGSRDNIVEWTPRLRAAWDAALAQRNAVVARRKLPQPIRPEDRPLFLGEGGEPLQKSSLDSAWQRMVRMAIDDGAIDASQRFSLHDLKRKGGTDTAGTRADKQDALGVTEAMMNTYDKSVPTVKPSAAD